MENFNAQNMEIISNICADNTINIDEKQNQYNVDILKNTIQNKLKSINLMKKYITLIVIIAK